MSIRTLMFTVLILLYISTISAAQESKVLTISEAPELFVDHHLIDSLTNAELKLWEPRQAESVVAFDKPWEGRYAGYVTVLHDGDKYRMYYRGLPVAQADGSDAETTCYAESVDGVRWTKPELDIVQVEGRNTNIVLANHAPFSHNFSPFIDTNPNAHPDARFKAIAGTSKTGLMTFTSPDGIHWTRASESAIITAGAFDSQNVGFWSEQEQQYLCYFRVWSETEFKGYRSVGRSTSKDFITWSEPVEMTYGDSPREHLYTNQTHPYFRNPNLYIAIAARFMPGRRVVEPDAFEKIGGEAKYSGD